MSKFSFNNFFFVLVVVCIFRVFGLPFVCCFCYAFYCSLYYTDICCICYFLEFLFQLENLAQNNWLNTTKHIQRKYCTTKNSNKQKTLTKCWKFKQLFSHFIKKKNMFRVLLLKFHLIQRLFRVTRQHHFLESKYFLNEIFWIPNLIYNLFTPIVNSDVNNPYR